MAKPINNNTPATINGNILGSVYFSFFGVDEEGGKVREQFFKRERFSKTMKHLNFKVYLDEVSL